MEYLNIEDTSGSKTPLLHPGVNQMVLVRFSFISRGYDNSRQGECNATPGCQLNPTTA